MTKTNAQLFNHPSTLKGFERSVGFYYLNLYGGVEWQSSTRLLPFMSIFLLLCFKQISNGYLAWTKDPGRDSDTKAEETSLVVQSLLVDTKLKQIN